MVRHHGWYAENGGRNYPLDDCATGEDDTGEMLPKDILVDACIRFPESLGRFAYLSSATVTDSLLSLTFMAFQRAAQPGGREELISDTGEFLPLATLTLPISAVEEDVSYALSPQAPGVGGWVVLGGGIRNSYRGRFSTPAQSALLARCARWYKSPPVRSLGKENRLQVLRDVVNLRAGNDFSLTYEPLEINGQIRDAIVMRLTSAVGEDVLQKYLGPCDGRPESGTCATPAIERINEVTPDCDGVIEVEFQGSFLVATHASGYVVDHPLNVIDMCTKADTLPNYCGVLPTEFTDYCNANATLCKPDDSGGSSAVSSEIPPEPTSSYEEGTLPYFHNFDDCTAPDWIEVYGSFQCENDDSPVESLGAGPPEAVSSSFNPYAMCFASAEFDRMNGAVWGRELPTTTNKRITTDLILYADAAERNAGLVLNYHLVQTPTPHYEYFYVSVDLNTDSLRVRRFNGTGFTPDLGAAEGLGIRPNEWYRLKVFTSLASLTTVLMSVTLESLTTPGLVVTLDVSSARFLPSDGLFGVGADQAHSCFSYFAVEEWP